MQFALRILQKLAYIINFPKCSVATILFVAAEPMQWLLNYLTYFEKRNRATGWLSSSPSPIDTRPVIQHARAAVCWRSW